MNALQTIGESITLLGTLICVIGAIGLIRLPDFFARTHGGSVTDTLGAGLAVLGMILYTFGMDAALDARLLIVFKLISIITFLLVTSPISGHALTRSAYEAGVGRQGLPDLKDLDKVANGILVPESPDHQQGGQGD